MDKQAPVNVKKIKLICLVLLLVLFAVDIGLYFGTHFYAHPHFPAERTQIDKHSYLFYPVFAFMVCLLLIVISKRVVGQVLQREDDYYND